ncbi:MAG: LemA family protein [Thermoleophilia bacterium]|nr:LemA family protein [Thermoleophilia bacterium]
MLALYTVAGLTALCATWAVYTHNVLVRARAKVQEAFSGIDVQLKKRQDLVPNLVQTVSGYVRHERVSLTTVTEARTRAVAASTPVQVDAAESLLDGQLRGLLAAAERYPELRASGNFAELIAELADIETEIQAARGLYNQNVEVLNSYAQSFPANLVAGRMRDVEYPFLRFDGVWENTNRLIGEGFAA